MAYKCVDCGANAEIYDDDGAPFCLPCLNVRDRKSRMQDAAIRDMVQSTREEYNLALTDLKTAHALLGDLDPGHPDGHCYGRQTCDSPKPERHMRKR